MIPSPEARIEELLDGMRLKRAPSGIPAARSGVFGLLGAHDSNLSRKEETDFRIPNELRKQLRDSGSVVVTHPDGQEYLYVHGIVVHSNAAMDGAEKRLKTRVSALRDFFLANGLAQVDEDIRVHLKGFNLRGLDDLREAIGGHATGLKKALKAHAGPLRAMHSVVMRIRLRPETSGLVKAAFLQWKRTGFLTRSSGKGGTDVLMDRARKPGVLTSVSRIEPKKMPKLYRKDAPGQLLFPERKMRGRR